MPINFCFAVAVGHDKYCEGYKIIHDDFCLLWFNLLWIAERKYGTFYGLQTLCLVRPFSCTRVDLCRNRKDHEWLPAYQLCCCAFFFFLTLLFVGQQFFLYYFTVGFVRFFVQLSFSIDTFFAWIVSRGLYLNATEVHPSPIYKWLKGKLISMRKITFCIGQHLYITSTKFTS